MPWYIDRYASDPADGRLHSESSSYSSASKTRGGTTDGFPGSPSLVKLGRRDWKEYEGILGESRVATLDENSVRDSCWEEMDVVEDRPRR